MWTQWWLWAAAGIVLVIIEVFAPAFVFLGFAIGAGVTSLFLAVGMTLSLPRLLLLFAVVSLVAWVVLRKLFSLPGGQSKTFDHDINDN